MVLGCSGGWVQHLGVFARLYSLVCICLPVEVRALPLHCPPATILRLPVRAPLYFHSSKAASKPVGYKPHI